MTTTEQEKKGWLRQLLNAIIFLVSISFLLLIVAWQSFGFDLLDMHGAFTAIQHRFPYLYGVILLAYLIFSAVKHGAAYKNDRRQSNLVWAILLWLLAASAVMYLVILVLNPR